MGASSIGVATVTGFLTENLAAGGTMALQRFPQDGLLSGSSRTIAVTGSTNATPIVVTATAHGLVTSNVVTISGVTGNTNANGTWRIVRLTANTFSLYSTTTDLAAVGNGTHGGTVVCTSRACLVCPTATFTGMTGWNVEIIDGPGLYEVRRIVSVPNATTVSVIPEWGQQPDNNSFFRAWIKRGPIFLKSYSFFAGTAAMGTSQLSDGLGGDILAALGPAGGLPANGTLNWSSQSSMGIPFFVGPYLTIAGTGAFLSYEFERA